MSGGVLISDSERMFILTGVEQNLRVDGRACLEYRHIEAELGVAANCSGSAHVRVANTDVLVGIKAELGTPDPFAPESGRIEFFVDLTANADPEFEGSGGDIMGQQLAAALTEAYVSRRFLDLSPLCLVKGHYVWVLYVDVLILELGSRPSFYDVVSIAVKAALTDLKVPQVEVCVGEDGKPEITLPDDPFAVESLPINNIPCFVTLSKLGGQFVVDVSAEEAECSTANICCAVAGNGKIASTFKTGPGSIYPENLVEALQLCQDIGVNLHKALNKKLKKALEQSSKTNGFLM